MVSPTTTDVSSQPPVDNPRTSFISPHVADVAPTGQENARTLVERQNERTTSDQIATTKDGKDLEEVVCVNPVSVKVKYAQGQIVEARQYPDDNPGIGEGPNFATASVSLQKMLVMIRETKQAARNILSWIFDDWVELKGYEDKTLQVAGTVSVVSLIDGFVATSNDGTMS